MKRLKSPGKLLLLSSMLIAPSIHALYDGSESSFLEPLPVVLTVSRVPAVRADLPAAVTILDEDLIRATGYRDVGRLLRLVPGMQTGQERGNSYWMTYHGLGKDYPNQLRVLIDGRSVFMDAMSHTGAKALAMEDIERIEVVRGSDFALHGSNGYLGLVNVVTRHSSEEPRAQVRLSAGEHGVADLVVRGAVRNDAGSVRMTAQSVGDKGFSGLSDDRRIQSLNLRSDLRIDDANSLLIYADASVARRGLGFPDTRFNAAGLRDETTRAHRARVSWRHQLGPDADFDISIHHGEERIIDEWTVFVEAMPELDLPDFTLPVDANNRNRWSSLEFQHRSAPTANTRVSWGAELRRESLRSPAFFFSEKRHRRDTARAFANAEWRFAPAWLLNASAMAERVSDLPTRVAPRAFLIWQPTADLNWRVGYTRAYHQPTLFEQRADTRIVHPSLGLLQRRHIADPGIRAQRIDVLEGGVLWSDRGLGTLDLRVFQEKVSHLIRRIPLTFPPGSDPAPTPFELALGSSSWQNHPRSVRLGGIESEWHSGRYHGAQFILTHSLVRASGGDRRIRRGVASHTASLTWLQDWNGWHSSATLSRRGRMDASTGFVPGYQYIVPALTQLDASVWREIRFGDHKGELRLTGINLLKRQQEVAFNPVQITAGRTHPNRANRSVYASLSLEF